MKTAAVYIRVSTDKQEELSPESQLDKAMEYAKSNGYYIPKEYIFMELGVSGRKADKRPQFQRMIALAKSKDHPIDTILVWKFSRFARNQEESIVYKSMLKRDNVDVVSISEYISDDMFGKLIERIIEWMDEYYSIRLADDVFRGMKKNAELGNYQCSPPLGYRIPYHGALPEIVPEQAAIICKIFNMYVNDGLSIFAITVKLNELGVKTKQGKSFQKRSIEYILKNPTYCGYSRWNTVDNKSKTMKDKSEWIIRKGNFEPIISEEIFQAAQERLEHEYTPRKAKPVYNQKHWLSGMVKCSSCGRSLSIGHTTKNGKKYYYMQCYGYAKALCTHNHQISILKLEPAILEAISSVLTHDDFEYSIARKDVSSDLELLRSQLAKLDSQEKRIKEAYINGIDSIEEYKENKAMLSNQREKLENDIYSLEHRPIDLNEMRREMRERIASAYAVISDSTRTNDERAAALRSIVEKIVFNRDEQQIQVFYHYL